MLWSSVHGSHQHYSSEKKKRDEDLLVTMAMNAPKAQMWAVKAIDTAKLKEKVEKKKIITALVNT